MFPTSSRRASTEHQHLQISKLTGGGDLGMALLEMVEVGCGVGGDVAAGGLGVLDFGHQFELSVKYQKRLHT